MFWLIWLGLFRRCWLESKGHKPWQWNRWGCECTDSLSHCDNCVWALPLEKQCQTAKTPHEQAPHLTFSLQGSCELLLGFLLLRAHAPVSPEGKPVVASFTVQQDYIISLHEEKIDATEFYSFQSCLWYYCYVFRSLTDIQELWLD